LCLALGLHGIDAAAALRLIPVTTNAYGYLTFQKPGSVALADGGVARRVGEHMHLFDMTESHFLALSLNPANTSVCAFVRMDAQGNRAAWVTGEKMLVFSRSARSVPASLPYWTNDCMAVVGEDDRRWAAVLERNGLETIVHVPKETPGVTFIATPPAEWTARQKLLRVPAGAPPKPVVIYMSGRTGGVTGAPDTGMAGLAADGPQLPIVAIELLTNVPPEADSTLVSPTSSISVAIPPPDLEPKESMTRSTVSNILSGATMASSAVLDFLRRHSIALVILVVVLFVETVIVIVLWRERQRRRPIHPVVRLSTAAEVFPTEPVRLTLNRLATQHGIPNSDLHGELKAFSMGQVVQFFHSSGESGTLSVTSGNNGDVDTLVFDRGSIIDASTSELSGEAAADHILRRRKGSFSFRREDNTRRLRVIIADTMGLLLEAHRRIDEGGYSD
jgi:hypothetical protein